MKKKIVVMGGAADGLVIAESIKKVENYEISGFINDEYKQDFKINGVPVLCRLSDWNKLPEDVYFIQALNTINKANARLDLLLRLEIPENRWANVVDPLAMVSSEAVLGYGIYIGPFVTVQPNVKIANHVSVRAGANLGHDVEVGPFCYIGPNAVLCGRVRLKEGVHIGPGACVIDKVVVEKYTILGACSVLTKNSKSSQKLFGIPAKNIRDE